MKYKKFSLFFDQQDKDILYLINRLLENHQNLSEDNLLHPELHPHGIKEMVTNQTVRMAYAVVNLLRNLESGETHANDRLLALRSLYDEVLNSTHSALRRNTARVLMQIMKDIVRAHGNYKNQIQLVHDFRKAAQGTPHIIRYMLKRYHLSEMPEEWNQIAFDDHVYDVNTRGRKTPTHLIMDAWIKGLRSLTVAYEYWINPEAAKELLEAAEITEITIRIGIEYQIPFHNKFIKLFWIPRGFSSNNDFLDFLNNPQMIEIMNKGRDVLAFRKECLFFMLKTWNTVQKPDLENLLKCKIPDLEQETFLRFVNQGQASAGHLAECLHQHLLPYFKERALFLSGKNDESSKEQIKLLENTTTEYIEDNWLNIENYPELLSIFNPTDDKLSTIPELLRINVKTLVHYLNTLNAGYRLVLGTTNLYAEDVIEILHECEGCISHIEIFNLKDWVSGKLIDIENISSLQQALTQGKGPFVKQMVTQIIKKYEKSNDINRANIFKNILQNVSSLWAHYRQMPLKSRMGTGSASRGSLGMGIVLKDTLPNHALNSLSKEKEHYLIPIPIYSPVEEHIIFKNPDPPSFWQKIGLFLHKLPFCKHLGLEKIRIWKSAREDCQVREKGNIANLGAINLSISNNLLDTIETKTNHHSFWTYLNTNYVNILKVSAGFISAFLSFQYTQQWWLLTWFGAFIWFAITGIRNIMQMVVAAMGATKGTLLYWKAQINVNRLCDSLMYTGISVFLLEVLIRVWFLEKTFNLTVANNSLLVFTVLNIFNGFYIFTHNIFRGFPREAAIGNLFRSFLSIPIASLYSYITFNILLFFDINDPHIYIVPSAAVISKMASDTVAAIIEGYADSQVNIRMRRWDYKSKLNLIFSNHTRLELLYPNKKILNSLTHEGGLGENANLYEKQIERSFIINALDLMYIWYYQPRAQEALTQIIKTMPDAEKKIFIRTQRVLTRERDISQMLVDGLLGKNFSKPLAFFLEKRRQYLKAITKACTLFKKY